MLAPRGDISSNSKRSSEFALRIVLSQASHCGSIRERPLTNSLTQVSIEYHAGMSRA